MVAEFDESGWAVFPPEPSTRDWAAAALPSAAGAIADPAYAHLHECEGTWFVGLDALPNDASGAVAGSGPLSGKAVDFTRSRFGWPPLHRAQISVVFPGYPKPRNGEGEKAFRYRLRRDAAHVDGVIGQGAPKRRFVKEPHSFILGLGLESPGPDAAPLVVWEGSHLIMQESFRSAFERGDRREPGQVDVTEIYTEARKRCFEECQRRSVPLVPGEAVLLHPLLLHGVASWTDGEGRRSTAYFRPPHPRCVDGWLAA